MTRLVLVLINCNMGDNFFMLRLCKKITSTFSGLFAHIIRHKRFTIFRYCSPFCSSTTNKNPHEILSYRKNKKLRSNTGLTPIPQKILAAQSHCPYSQPPTPNPQPNSSLIFREAVILQLILLQTLWNT